MNRWSRGRGKEDRPAREARREDIAKAIAQMMRREVVIQRLGQREVQRSTKTLRGLVIVVPLVHLGVERVLVAVKGDLEVDHGTRATRLEDVSHGDGAKLILCKMQ